MALHEVIGYEIGHSFFYHRRAGERPRRRDFDSAEEDFCDAFALGLVARTAQLVARTVTPHPHGDAPHIPWPGGIAT